MNRVMGNQLVANPAHNSREAWIFAVYELVRSFTASLYTLELWWAYIFGSTSCWEYCLHCWPRGFLWYVLFF